MKRILSIVLAAMMVVAVFAMSVSAVTNSNHNIDTEGGKGALIENNQKWQIAGWSIVDTAITKVGYRIDGGAINWTVTSVGVRSGDATTLENDAWEDTALEELAVTLPWIVNGLENYKAYRIKITADISAYQTGSHTVEVIAYAGEEFNPFRGATYTFEVGKADTAEPTNSLIEDTNTGYTDETETSFHVSGWFGVTAEIADLGYVVDDGEVVYGNMTYYSDPTLAAHTQGNYSYRFETTIALSGVHEFINIIAKDYNGAETSILKNASGFYTIPVTGYEPPHPYILNYYQDEVTFEDNQLTLVGWFGADGVATIEYGYTVDGGSPVFDGSVTLIPLDIINNPDDATIHANHQGGHYATRFSGTIDLSYLPAGAHSVMLVAKLADGTNYIMDVFSTRQGATYPVEVTVTAGSSVIVGDVDGSGQVNNKDVTLLFRYVGGNTVANFNTQAADMDGSGQINNKDVTLLFRKVSSGG